jgi:membrane protease YdiL (CAAX protease family)
VAVASVGELFWNGSEGRLRALVRIGFFVGLWRALSLLLDLSLIVPLASVIRALVPAPLLWLERGLHFVLYLAAVLVAVALCARWPDKRPVADYALVPSRKQWGDLLAGTLLGLALMAVIFVLLWLMGWVQVEQLFFVNLPGLPFAVALLGPLLAFVVIALAEELVFRGYMLRNAAEGLNSGGDAPAADRALVFAWLLSSVLFGLFHVANPNATAASTLNLVLAGLMLGLPVVLTGRLAFAIGLHFAWNFAQGTLFGFPVSGNAFEGTALFRTTLTGPALWTGGSFGPEAGLLGLVMLVIGSLLIVVWANRREGGLRVAGELAQYPSIHRRTAATVQGALHKE